LVIKTSNSILIVLRGGLLFVNGLVRFVLV
jgi:hypothetical protein